MAEPPATASGAIIAALVLIGAVGGAFFGQSSAGMIGGAAIGIMLAVLLWLRERRRIGR